MFSLSVIHVAVVLLEVVLGPGTLAQDVSGQNASVQDVPIQNAPIQDTPIQNAPVQDVPVQNAPVQNVPIQDTPIQNAPVQDVPARNVSVQGAPAQNAPIQDAPVLYDAYFGKPVAGRRAEYLATVDNGTSGPSCALSAPPCSGGAARSRCTVAVRACGAREGRRVDGTCSNPRHPSRGASLTPLPRLLPPRFGPASTLRPARDGSELPSARVLRTTLLGSGYFRDHEFTALAATLLVSAVADSADLFHILRYALVSECCAGNAPNRADPLCIAISVPPDDPYLRRAGVRCMNLTRVETFQDYGCLPHTLPAEKYSRVTPLLDLSPVYGYTEARSRAVRAGRGGLLAARAEGNREVPAGTSPFCLAQRQPENLICYNFGDDFHGNLVLEGALSAMWFFREHNRVARRLASLNPCWGDEKLFQTARQINIAQWQHMYYYELVAEFLGRENALAEGVIYDTAGFVNDFEPAREPGVYREFVVGTRWFHNIQPGLSDLYRNKRYAGSRSVVDDGLKSGVLAVNNTEAELTQGSYLQPADRIDYVMDPDLGQRVYGQLQTAADLPAIDVMRGRDAGLAPYNHYRRLCGYRPAERWEDFYDTIDEQKVAMLSRLYDDVDDVELIVALGVERLLPGAWVPPTLYCIMVHNLLLWRRSDKFFFEHGNYPAAMTLPQLNEVRRTSVARLLCDNGAGVAEIQPRAFLRRRPGNELTSCKYIPGMDLTKWRDPWCAAEK